MAELDKFLPHRKQQYPRPSNLIDEPLYKSVLCDLGGARRARQLAPSAKRATAQAKVIENTILDMA